MIDWSRTTKKENKLIIAIAKRAYELLDDLSLTVTQLNMYFAAAHIYSGPLDLQGLLDGKDSDIIHDTLGIIRNLDQETGKLLNNFVPRHIK